MADLAGSGIAAPGPARDALKGGTKSAAKNIARLAWGKANGFVRQEMKAQAVKVELQGKRVTLRHHRFGATHRIEPAEGVGGIALNQIEECLLQLLRYWTP